LSEHRALLLEYKVQEGYRARLDECKARLGEYGAFLDAYRALLDSYRALLDASRALLDACRALHIGLLLGLPQLNSRLQWRSPLRCPHLIRHIHMAKETCIYVNRDLPP